MKFTLTQAAKRDLVDIGIKTQEKWGKRKRVSYLKDIDSAFSLLARFPRLGNAHQDNEMILTLLLSTTKVTPDQVLQAMETIHLTDVKAWSQEVFGQSILSKRKLAFSTDKNYIKVALIISDRLIAGATC